MRIILKLAIPLFLAVALMTSCNNASQNGTEPAEAPTIQTEYPEGTETDMKITEIKKTATSAASPADRKLVVPTDNTRAVPTVSSLKLDGYLDTMINGNIEAWALSALIDNPNIIEQIENTGTGASITSILGDAFTQLSSGLVWVNIAEGKGHDGGCAIEIQSKKQGTYGDIDYKISKIDGIRLDWRGAEEVWFFADASEYSNLGSKIGFAIQETNTDGQGNLNGVYESWGIRIGSEVSLYDVNLNTGWESTTVVKSNYTDWNGGRISLPAGFKGWIRIPLDSRHMAAYWSSGTMNNKMDLYDVNQFQICVEGNAGSVGKSLYLSGYTVVGNGFDNDAPLPTDDQLTSAPVFDPGKLEKATGNIYTGGIMPWYDEFPGKLLTGMAFNYLISPTNELKQAGDELAEALKNAQKEDGYLGIYTGSERFGGGGSNWDVWGHYHMTYGLLLWYRVSGNADALDTAQKAADCVYRHFVEGGITFHSAGSQTMNLGISHVFAELYKETGDKRYLDTAVQIVEEDWPKSGNWMNNVMAGKDYYQSTLPRWEALHTVITLGTLWEITGVEKYYTALEDIWWSIAKTDRHNTGGFTSGETACGDPYNTGAIETCCTIAWMALGSEYLQLSRDSLVADELELSYYNGMLGSLLDGERYCTYNTPMEGAKRVASQTDIAFQYNSGSPDFNCCQANLSRGLGEISQWACLTDDENVYLNFYGNSVMEAKTPASQALQITESTSYPLNGAIRITLKLENAEAFTLALRIPTWAVGSTVTVDGETAEATGGMYYTVTREWKNGDTIDVNLGMSFHTWTHEADPTRASVYYGPILLAAEGIRYNRTAEFSYKDFAKTDIRLEDDGKHWMSFTIQSDGEEYTFYDFASAGKFNAHTTWFKMDNIPARMSAEKGKAPIWCNTMLYEVSSQEN